MTGQNGGQGSEGIVKSTLHPFTGPARPSSLPCEVQDSLEQLPRNQIHGGSCSLPEIALIGMHVELFDDLWRVFILLLPEELHTSLTQMLTHIN